MRRQWRGDVHTLTVHSVSEPADERDPGELDYDIEHPLSCAREDAGYPGGIPVMAWTCDVAWTEQDGLADALAYSGTAVTEPGIYQIRAWGSEYSGPDGTEYDGSVEVAPDDPVRLFPVLGAQVKCGLRTDLPKKARRHNWVSLGTDTRNRGSNGFLDCEILACRQCGTDKAVTP